MFNFSCKLLILILDPGSEIRSLGYPYLNTFTSLERFSLLTQRKELDFNFNFKVSLFSLDHLGPGSHRIRVLGEKVKPNLRCVRMKLWEGYCGKNGVNQGHDTVTNQEEANELSKKAVASLDENAYKHAMSMINR